MIILYGAEKIIGINKAWKWETDTDIGHSTFAMGDVLSIANADLQSNNSQVYEYLNHLTSNSIYVDLLVANQAFISRLAADQAFINELTVGVIASGNLITVGDAHAYSDEAAADAVSTADSNANDLLEAYIDDTGISRNYTVISNGKIVTGLIDVEAIKATAGFFTNITVTGSLVSSDFNPSANRGYKLWMESGIGRAQIPLLECTNLANIHGRKEALYMSCGITPNYVGRATTTHITTWQGLTTALFPGFGSPDNASASMVHICGKIGEQAIERLNYVIDTHPDSPSVLIQAFYHGEMVYNHYAVSWPSDVSPNIYL